MGIITLKYDIADGTFLLKTFSHVKMRCRMNFRLYPFDTQTCKFQMTPSKYIGQQVAITSVRLLGRS